MDGICEVAREGMLGYGRNTDRKGGVGKSIPRGH